MSDAYEGFWLVLKVPENYMWAMVMLALNCWHCTMVGMDGGGARGVAFTEDHMKQYADIHKENYPEGEINLGGLPDQGEGWYSRDLPLKEWYDLNVAIRNQKNYLE